MSFSLSPSSSALPKIERSANVAGKENFPSTFTVLSALIQMVTLKKESVVFAIRINIKRICDICILIILRCFFLTSVLSAEKGNLIELKACERLRALFEQVGKNELKPTRCNTCFYLFLVSKRG